MRFLGLASFLGLTLLWASGAAAFVLIEDRQAAVSYIDQVFQENGCRMSQADFLRQMEVDGVAPTIDDMAHSLEGTNKIIRQRRIYAALEELFERDQMGDSADNEFVAISKFGGCA